MGIPDLCSDLVTLGLIMAVYDPIDCIMTSFLAPAPQ